MTIKVSLANGSCIFDAATFGVAAEAIKWIKGRGGNYIAYINGYQIFVKSSSRRNLLYLWRGESWDMRERHYERISAARLEQLLARSAADEGV